MEQKKAYNNANNINKREKSEISSANRTSVPKGNRRRVKRVKKRFKIFSIRAGMDMPFFALVVILVAIGLVMMFSASYVYAYYNYDDSYYFIKTQLPMAIVGLVAMFFISYLDYHHLHKIALPAMVLSFIFLIAVLFMPSMNQVNRWIQLGPFSFQASEITKFAFVLFFAHFISVHFSKMDRFKYGVLPFIAILIPTVLLLIKEPHLSCAVIVILITVVMMFIGGTKLRWFAIGIGFVLIVALVFRVDKMLGLTGSGYAGTRLQGWLDPFNEEAWQETWQTRNSLYAIGSGGFLGLGLGNSRQKYLYLPEPQNDFIFAVVCEELGFVGATIIILLFGLLIWRGINIAIKARDRFGTLLGIGFTVQLALQVILNIAVVTNTLPNTGISLPFFSHGGTSLMILLAQMGIVLSISRTSMIEKSG